MPKFKDIAGQKFGRLQVMGLTGEINTDRRHLWYAKCDCGNDCKVISKALLSGETRSCGCLRAETCIKRSTTHGLRRTREYEIWLGIKKRCLDPNHSTYAGYGAKGITIFEEWAYDFEKFLAYVGKCPEKDSTMDRIDNTKGYFPDNVRWLPPDDQSRNKAKFKSNTSGVTGVSYRKHKGVVNGYIAGWRSEGKRRSKEFAISKFGDELAFFMACEYREQMINLLRLSGVFYSENHGK